MNALKIKILAPGEASPWANEESMKTFEGEATVTEAIILEGGMASGLPPSVALKVDTIANTSWVLVQLPYNLLDGLHGAMKGCALKSGAIKS